MNPEIKQRLDQIRRGEVPEGYCQAKDCIYPSDWICKKMSDWLELIERPLTLEDQETYQLVTVRRSFGGVDSRGHYKGRDVLVKTYFEVKEGDFLISKRQIAHGACGIVPKSLDCAVVSNEYNVFVPKTETNIDLFNMMMQLPHYKRLFYLMSDGVHIEKLLFKTKDWMKRVIAMPPLPEQQKIAQILTMQDKLIELQARKIEQLQALKKACLQRMFPKKGCDRPEIRFPEFTDAWEQREFGNVFEEYSEKNHEELPPLTIIQGKGTILRDESDRNLIYDKAGLKNYKLVNKDDFILHLRSFEGGLEVANSKGIVSPAYHIFHGENVDTGFYYPFFRSKFFISVLLKPHVYGIRDGKSIDVDGMKTIKVPYPKIEEQQAIGNYFKSLDHLITLHQRKLDEEKQKKKALMQLLLTGIVRVKI